MIGVGGAYTAFAENIEGAAVNSAAPAVRSPYSTDWFEFDFSASVSFPGAFAKGPFANDFDNHVDNTTLAPQYSSTSDFLDINVGAMAQFGRAGVAVTGDLQQYSVTSQNVTTPQGAAPQGAAQQFQGLTLQVGRWKALGGYAILDGQLALGGGARIVTMQIEQNGGGSLVTMAGAAPEVGGLLMPIGQPWRIGATVRAAVSGGNGLFSSQATTSASGVRTLGGFALPNSVGMPWEVEAGVAYQVGPRPHNPGWEDPHEQEAQLRARIARDRAERERDYAEQLARLSPEGRVARRAEQHAEEKSLRAIEDVHLDEETERLAKVRRARYANWPREKILLLASVLVAGPSGNATSLEGFLNHTLEPVGRHTTVAPRVGLESEPLPNRMLLRTGTYVEPTRYDGDSARQHFTFGTDVRLFPFSFWGLLPEVNLKLGVFLDVAPRYTNWGIGISNWH